MRANLRCFGHKRNLETAIYDLGLVDPMRPVTEKLGNLLGL